MSKSSRSPSSTPAASMSEFMRSTQATNSLSSAGRVGSMTRCTWTPAITSSEGDSSPPRVRTWTSASRSTSASESFRTCLARPPSMSGGYSQERIRTRFIDGLRLEQRRQTEVRGEIAHAWVDGLGGVYGLQQGLRVGGRPRVRVVAGLAAVVHEGPVARLQGEQLARRAHCRWVLHSAPCEGAQQAELASAGRPDQVRNRG